MRIECEINLNKTLNAVYKPGKPVSGTISYNVNEFTTFTKIIVSLKGMSYTKITNTLNRGIIHVHEETLVDIDNVITDEDKLLIVPYGSQSVQFYFVLPPDLPPSFKYNDTVMLENIYCKIHYYVRIKFIKAGVFKFSKRFKKVLVLESNITPSLPRNPAVHFERKKFASFFSSQQQMVTLKTFIYDSVIGIGRKVKFECEVENLTKLTIKSLNIKLIEVHRFYKTFHGNVKKISKDVEGTVEATASISRGQTNSFNFELNVPYGKVSLENSKAMSRKYYVKIVAVLPSPYKDVVLEIPLQIGCTGNDGLLSETACSSTSSVRNQSTSLGAPPSYWEVMGEDKDNNTYQ